MNAAELALTEAIKSALTKAAVSASDLDYINAHRSQTTT
jgi:3-oxoacyl-(acyl-carrier-protein) synthase